MQNEQVAIGVSNGEQIMFEWLRKLLRSRKAPDLSGMRPRRNAGNAADDAPPEGSPLLAGEEPLAKGLFVYVRIPGRIEPLERGERFEDPLEASLRAANLGEVTGGGSWLSEPDEQGRRFVASCGIDLRIDDPDEGIPFVIEQLRKLNAPKGTRLEFRDGDKEQRVVELYETH